MARSKFWMVLGHGEPVYRHSTKSTAAAEAERLARLNPGSEFIVLESVAVCRKTELTWEPMTVESGECDQVPF